MAHLGDFGAALKELDRSVERDTFGFFGETFSIVGEIPPMLMFQLAASMTGKVDEAEGLAAMWEALRTSLDEPELEPWIGEGDDPRPAPVRQFDKLHRLATEKRADLHSLMALVMRLFQESGGRPTVQPANSSAGLSSTSPSSSPSSSTPPASGQVVPGEVVADRDPSTPHLRPVSEVLAG
jgi:hypothetical protein